MAKVTREDIINAAIRLFNQSGYHATSMRDIARAVNIKKPSLYHHFGSKEEFTAAVIERYLMLEEAHCRQVLGNVRQAPLKRLRRYFEDLIRLAGQTAPISGCLLGSLSLEVAGVSPLLQGHLSSSFTSWQNAVAAVLREAMEKGDLPKSIKAATLAGFILNSWEGALLRSQADKNDAPLKDFMHYVFNELLK